MGHARILLHDGVWEDIGSMGTGSTLKDVTTTSRACQDLEQTLRATRRQAQPSRRAFAKSRPNPQDEIFVQSAKREAQEDEWRRLLRRQRGAPSDRKSTNTWAETAIAAGNRPLVEGEQRPEWLEQAWETRLRPSHAKSKGTASIVGRSLAGSVVQSA